jgi:hypothetical protein
MNMAFGAPENESPTPSGVSRRTLVKGAAWAVPVIAIAATVPMAAASAPPCAPNTANSLTSWGVNSAWPASNNANCGQHADVVFIFQAGVTCGATQIEIVMGLPGSNDTTSRGAIWIWGTPTSGYRGKYGYLLTPGSAPTNQGNIAIPAGGITVPKYRANPAATAGWRDAHNGDNVVNDGIHVAIYNQSQNGNTGTCQKVGSLVFDWYWRDVAKPAEWWHMQNVLTIGSQNQISLGAPYLVGKDAPGLYTPIGY